MIQFISDHFLIFVLLVAAVFTLLWLGRNRVRLNMGWPVTIFVTVLHVLFGVFCVKAFAFLESGASSDGFSQMSIFGATFFMPVGYFVGARLTKRKPADVFDIFTICMLFTLACSRVNCLKSGCCGGVPFFGTAFCWPTREIEIAYYLLFIIVLSPRIRKKKTHGEVYPLYMLSYGALRFLLEFVRVSSAASGLHLTHLWAVISIVIGLFFCLWQKAHPPRTRGKNRRKEI